MFINAVAMVGSTSAVGMDMPNPAFKNKAAVLFARPPMVWNSSTGPMGYRPTANESTMMPARDAPISSLIHDGTRRFNASSARLSDSSAVVRNDSSSRAASSFAAIASATDPPVRISTRRC